MGITTMWPRVSLEGLNHLYLYANARPVSASDFYGRLDEGGPRRPGGGGSFLCPLVKQVGPIGMGFLVGLPRFLFICVYNCGAKCPPTPDDLIYEFVWLWNPPFKCVPEIRNPGR